MSRIDDLKLKERVLAAWKQSDPRIKATECHSIWECVENGTDHCTDLSVDSLSLQPGRPSRPELVAPNSVRRRRLGSPEGRAALIHAIAHIEFNAINLALDAVLRFPNMPVDYYYDWLSVAADEARHFLLLADRLERLEHAYGDFPAHNGLWEMSEKTSADVLERMALVPRVLEARGLDVTPGMIERLRSVGDMDTVGILQIILHEEERHVEVGSRWFRYCCSQRNLEPDSTFEQLLEYYYEGQIKLPLNEPARRRAQFSEGELAMLYAAANKDR